MARSEKWEGSKMAIWEGERVLSREGGTEFNDEPVLYCSREAKCKQRFTAGICK